MDKPTKLEVMQEVKELMESNSCNYYYTCIYIEVVTDKYDLPHKVREELKKLVLVRIGNYYTAEDWIESCFPTIYKSWTREEKKQHMRGFRLAIVDSIIAELEKAE